MNLNGLKEDPSGQLVLLIRVSGTPPGRPVDKTQDQAKPGGLLDKMLHLRSSSVVVSFSLVYQLVTQSHYTILSTTKDSF